MNLLTMIHLKKHENGFYYIIYDRKRRRSLGTKDKALAERLFRRGRREYLEGKIIGLEGGAGKPLVEFWEEYEEYRFKTASKFSQQTDRQAFRVFRQALGDETRLGRISRKQVEKALANLGERVSPVSANTWFRHFKAALGKAVQWGYLKSNPCQGIKQLRPQEAYPRFLSEEEFDRLLTTEPDPRFRLFWRFQVFSGARRSESLAIAAKDINRQLRRIDLGRTKNGKPKFIVLTPKIEEVLAELGQEVGKLWPWQPDTVSHHFKATARTAGLECRLHDLRHTYGSWLVMRGVPLRTVQLLMGHQDSKTTERYAHLSAAHLEEAAGRL
jgi:site-specific recombinase XerD